MKMFIVRKVNLNRQKNTLLKDKEDTFAHRAKIKIPVEITSTGTVRNSQLCNMYMI